jgi:hypothetical protein
MNTVTRIFSHRIEKAINFSLISTTIEAVSLNRTSECRGIFIFFMCRRNIICNIFCITFEFFWINPIYSVVVTLYTIKHNILTARRIYDFCTYLRTKSFDLHKQHELVRFSNRNRVCLLRGTDWIYINQDIPSF